ncbi:hypothetical protein U0070_014927, partial [Myodes glareolus]
VSTLGSDTVKENVERLLKSNPNSDEIASGKNSRETEQKAWGIKGRDFLNSISEKTQASWRSQGGFLFPMQTKTSHHVSRAKGLDRKGGDILPCIEKLQVIKTGRERTGKLRWTEEFYTYTMKTTITMEHLASKCHWTEREAAVGDVIAVSSLKPKKKPGKCGRGHKQREINLKDSHGGSFGVLVATNIAACRLDIHEVDLAMQSCPTPASIHQVDRQNRKEDNQKEGCREDPGNGAGTHLRGHIHQPALINSQQDMVTTTPQVSIEMPVSHRNIEVAQWWHLAVATEQPELKGPGRISRWQGQWEGGMVPSEGSRGEAETPGNCQEQDMKKLLSIFSVV